MLLMNRLLFLMKKLNFVEIWFVIFGRLIMIDFFLWLKFLILFWVLIFYFFVGWVLWMLIDLLMVFCLYKVFCGFFRILRCLRLNILMFVLVLVVRKMLFNEMLIVGLNDFLRFEKEMLWIELLSVLFVNWLLVNIILGMNLENFLMLLSSLLVICLVLNVVIVIGIFWRFFFCFWVVMMILFIWVVVSVGMVIFVVINSVVLVSFW